MLRPCLTCGTLSANGTRCWTCDPKRDAARARRTPGRGSGYRAARFRDAVLANARMQCEAIEDGDRCQVSGPSKLQAHHVVPIAAGGDAHDPANGRALCRRHHDAFEKQTRAA